MPYWFSMLLALAVLAFIVLCSLFLCRERLQREQRNREREEYRKHWVVTCHLSEDGQWLTRNRRPRTPEDDLPRNTLSDLDIPEFLRDHRLYQIGRMHKPD
ncbi:hypothetical protein [Chitinilyticum aquatile]|uniref:hypothetical protein n=1 Tax=Chitinilyticum aquatile TaxID=362520 RepID=UPI0003F4F449|nr:hypothetical protein [Chitinilyticum aquatile]